MSDSVEKKQKAHIDAARAILRPSPVAIGRAPRWWHPSLLPTFPRWADHWGTTKLADGRLAFVCYPYSLSAEEHAECERVALLMGAHFWVTSNSWWFPGSTIRLVFAQDSSVKPRRTTM